jgi:hypothetical protein
MISFQKRFLFVHIPKTAGNSIQSILRRYSEDEIVALRPEQDGIERFGLRNPNYYEIKKHSTLAEYRAALGEERFSGLYKFTCVRNPWDRMVSYYFRPAQKAEAWDRKEFKKLILKVLSVADYLRLDEDKDPFGNVDYIMRFENLADDFRSVCAILGIPDAQLPQYNRSNREHYSKYYDDELRELVSKRFGPEIERFGYALEER